MAPLSPLRGQRAPKDNLLRSDAFGEAPFPSIPFSLFSLVPTREPGSRAEPSEAAPLWMGHGCFEGLHQAFFQFRARRNATGKKHLMPHHQRGHPKNPQLADG